MKRTHNCIFIGQLIANLVLGTIVMAESAYPPLEVSGANLRKTVEFLTAIQPYRNFQSQKSLNCAASFIAQCFNEYGLVTSRQTFQASGNAYVNVIGTIRPERKERIIVGAHYDVCGAQPGADDNASAVAGLLEAARLANNFCEELDCRIDFVAYSLEEPPFFATKKMGSYVHAQSLHETGVKIRGMICLEMIGFFTNREGSQAYPLPLMGLFYPSKGNFIAVVGNFASRGLIRAVKTYMSAGEIDVESLSAPAIVWGVDFSDHRNYWKFGYPAVMITDTAFYRNPHYHRPSDTIETLDFPRMQEVVKGVVWTVLNLEEG